MLLRVVRRCRRPGPQGFAARWALCLLVGTGQTGCTPVPEREIHEASVDSLLARLDDAEIEPSPTGRVETGVARVRDAERPAILFQAPGRVRFAGMHIHPAARLGFGVGIGEDPACVPPEHVVFRVSVEEPSRPPVVRWSKSWGAERRWEDAEVDLAAYAGRDVDIVLEADFTPAPGACRPSWSSPAIRSSGVAVRAAAVPISRLVLVRDLLGAAAPPIDLGSFVYFGRLLQAPNANLARGPSRGTPVAPAGPLRLSFDVPPRAVLALSGEVLRGPAGPPQAKDPVRFEARIEGSPALRRDIQTAAAPVAFYRTIPLDRLAGRKASLDLAVTGGGPGTLSWWTTAWLLRSEDVPRQTALEGRNLLLILVDTLRADQLGLYGSKRSTSPNLDRLGGESLVFDRAVSACSWTQPSVATLLTGRSPLEHGMIGGVPLDPAIETLAEALQSQGMMTLGLSSNPVIGRREGFHRGFETFVQIPWARAESVHQVFEDWLQGHRDTRWFAYLHYIDPHDSYHAPPPFAEAFTAGLTPLGSDKPLELLHKRNYGESSISLTPGDVEYLRATYEGEVLYWDFALGKLLDSLRRERVLDNTVVIVTSDHGEEFLEHGKLFHGFHLYDESVRVPLLIRAPGLVKPGREPRLFEARRLKDLATALASGRPLTPENLQGTGPAFSHTSMAFRQKRYETLASVRDEDWTYILWTEDGGAELYDRHQDPRETVNLAKQEPSTRARYDALLRAWLASGGSGRAAWRDPGLVERLRAAGYVQ